VLTRAKRLIPDFDGSYGATVTDFQSNAILGNLLTHQHPIATSTSQQEIADFAQSPKAVHDIFVRDSSGRLV
jgi:hypothetical protein